MITAGPTHEAIDPVRYIGNHSTGLMGFELASAAAKLGAEVVLITGPTTLKMMQTSVKVIPVVTAAEMYHRCQRYFKNADIVICAAAVADYRPKQAAKHKIKKSDKNLVLELVKNTDILMALGEQKTKQYLVGFALETDNGLENAKGKLKRKNLDAIVLNSMQDKGAGFGGTTNKISFIDTNLDITTFELKTKAEVAMDIFNEIIKRHDA